MNVVLSKATTMLVSGGMLFCNSGNFSRTARATSNAFAVEVLMTPSPILGWPLPRK